MLVEWCSQRNVESTALLFGNIGVSSLLARPNGQSRNYSRKLATQQATFWESYLRIDKCEDTKLQGHQSWESYDPACASYNCCLQCARFFGLLLVLTNDKNDEKACTSICTYRAVVAREFVLNRKEVCVRQVVFEQYPPTRPHKSHSFPWTLSVTATSRFATWTCQAWENANVHLSKKLQHTPRAHPRESPWPTMTGIPL